MDRKTLAVGACVLLVACATTQKKQLVETGAEAMSPAQRRDLFEATARVLDENPEYVDEFYAVARQHPKMLSRFFARATPDLKSKPIAETMAKLLANDQGSLAMVLAQSIDAVAAKPAARATMSKVMTEKAATVSDILTDDPTAVTAVMTSTIAAVEQKPKAQAPFHAAMKGSAPRVIAILEKDPSTLGVITEELLRVSVKDKPSLRKLLRKVGAVD